MFDTPKLIAILLLLFFDAIQCNNETAKQGQLVFAHVVSEILHSPCQFTCNFIGVVAFYGNKPFSFLSFAIRYFATETERQSVHIQMTRGKIANFGQKVMVN